MYDIYSLKELEKITPGVVKVRLIISSFEQFKKEVSQIAKIKHKYNVFKVKLDFKKETNPINLNMTNSLVKPKLKDILKKGIGRIQDKDVKQLLEEVLDV